MSSEQVAGILRQCSQQVRLVVARSVREPTTATTAGNSHNHSPTSSQHSSFTYETPLRMENEGLINNSQKKILLRTERLLESNHNLEKILDHLLEQVRQRCFLSLFPFYLSLFPFSLLFILEIPWAFFSSPTVIRIPFDLSTRQKSRHGAQA